jgi:hypothetical protein
MEIQAKKVKGGTERIVLQNAFLNLTVTFKRETVDGDGTATTIDYPTEQAQVQFDAETLENLSKADLAAMLEQAISQTKAKYK